MTRPPIAVPLSFNAGYVDTAGFLALQGLFTAHVTGNFVTLGATLVLGTSGAIGKLLALPVFCVVVVLVRGLGYWLIAHSLPQLRTLLTAKIVLLAIGSALAIRLGPFRDADSWPALVTGMTLVSAMAIQNAVQRIHLATAPPTTLMTGTTTQIMIDIADAVHGLSLDQKLVVRRRLSRMAVSVITFGLGCGAAASLYAFVNIWCFAIPPLLAFTTYFCTEEATPA
jgi:uncharacterized membrane protein YoaK (UPF0700 family)